MARRGRSRSKSRKRGRKLAVPRFPGPLADKMVMRHRYVAQVSVNPGLGTALAYIFSANGMFDPDVSGGGHQPLMFDEMSQFYNHYTVLGSKISARYISDTSGVSTGTTMCGINLKANATNEPNPTLIMEQNKAHYRILTNAQAGASTTVTHKASIKKFLGKAQLSDNDDVQGTSASNPAEQAYWHVFAAPIASTADPSAIYMIVSIDYIALWSERKAITQS